MSHSYPGLGGDDFVGVPFLLVDRPDFVGVPFLFFVGVPFLFLLIPSYSYPRTSRRRSHRDLAACGLPGREMRLAGVNFRVTDHIFGK